MAGPAGTGLERVTNIPFAQATSIMQTSQRDKVITVDVSDQIGVLTLLNDTPSGTIWQFLMNPLRYPTTRLATYAKAYQKYRYLRGSTFTIGGNVPFTIAGSLNVGCIANAEVDIPIGNTAAIYALPRAQNVPLTVRCTVEFVPESSDWYDLDISSDEVLKTDAAKLFIGLIGYGGLSSGTLTIPVFFNAKVQFKGTAVVDVKSAAQRFPATVWTSVGPVTIGTTVYKNCAGMRIDSQETISWPSMAAINTPYFITPAIEVPVSKDADGRPTKFSHASVLVYINNGTAPSLNFQFYSGLKDYYVDAPLDVQFTEPIDTRYFPSFMLLSALN